MNITSSLKMEKTIIKKKITLKKFVNKDKTKILETI